MYHQYNKSKNKVLKIIVWRIIKMQRIRKQLLIQEKNLFIKKNK
jgi:hypothetical protein